MSSVRVNGIDLYYEESGSPGGSPLLLLHAALQTAESMAPLRKLAEEAGYRVVAFDQRGHGRSEPGTTPWSVDLLAADALGFIDRVGLGQPAVAGYSMGGTVAVELACRGRVARLVALAARIDPNPHGRRAFNPDGIRARMPLWVNQLEAKHTLLDWQEIARRVGGMFQDFAGVGRERLGAVRCPTLVVQGDMDEMVPLEQAELLAASIPGASLVVIPRAKHPELLYRADGLRAVATFLAR